MYTYAHISFLLKDEILDIKFFSNIESLHKISSSSFPPPLLLLRKLFDSKAVSWGTDRWVGVGVITEPP